MKGKKFQELKATYLKACLNLLSRDSDVYPRYSKSTGNLGIGAEDALLSNTRGKAISWGHWFHILAASFVWFSYLDCIRLWGIYITCNRMDRALVQVDTEGFKGGCCGTELLLVAQLCTRGGEGVFVLILGC